MKRWLALGVVVLLGGWLVHSCRETDDELPATRAASVDPLQATPGDRALPRISSASSASIESTQALTEAADLVQKYLQAAGAARWDEANALWRDGRAPDARVEGGLRALLPAAAFRIGSDAPEPLGEAVPPERVRVPVQLRLTGTDGHFYRYTGHYTVRRDPVTRAWSIVEASVSAALDGR